MSIEIGKEYEFYCTMQQEYVPSDERLRNYTGQKVRVVRMMAPSTGMYEVEASDGHKFSAWSDELDGWQKDQGMYFWPDGTFGPDHDERFLVNERGSA